MPYIAKESDVQATVSDFGTFCDYIERETPLATKKGDLSIKACFKCNQILRNQRKGAKDTDRMFQYPSVSLWFSIARESGLVVQEDIKGGKTVFVTTDSYSEFKTMSVFSQYVLIFQTWYCFVNIGEQYMERGMQYILHNLVDGVFRELKENGSSKWYQDKNAKPGDFFSRGKITNYLFEHGYKTAHVLMDLGLIEIKESSLISARYKSPILSKIKPTPLGHSIMTASEYRRYRWFNVYVEEIVELDELETFEQMDEGNGEFITPFLVFFPDGEIDVQVISKLLFGHEDIESASYTFEMKVSLGKKCIA